MLTLNPWRILGGRWLLPNLTSIVWPSEGSNLRPTARIRFNAFFTELYGQISQINFWNKEWKLGAATASTRSLCANTQHCRIQGPLEWWLTTIICSRQFIALHPDNLIVLYACILYLCESTSVAFSTIRVILKTFKMVVISFLLCAQNLRVRIAIDLQVSF